MVVANSRNKSDILAEVELAHDIRCRESFMSIVIFLNLGGENWSIDVRIGLIEILHYATIESEVKVKIVITVV